MTTYAIGDIQGCNDSLQRLLDHLQFDPAADKLWFVGDLVNRGNASLEVLRFVYSLGDSAITVLGNHDFHLLAMWRASNSGFKPSSSLLPVLEAEDCDELLEWLRFRPLLHRDKKLGYTMVHAGLPPQWSVKQARKYAKEVENVLRSDQFVPFLNVMYGDQPDQWSEQLTGFDRIRFMVNCFSRLRFCSTSGKLNFSNKIGLNSDDSSLLPWFRIADRNSRNKKIVFGHWSTLQLYNNDNVYGIDTGCLWGGSLTAMVLDTPQPQFISLHCKAEANPHKYL